MRALVVPMVLSLIPVPASAASPQVEAAVKAFQTIGADTNRLEAFCELMQTEEENAEKAAPSAEAKMNKLLAELGPDFKAAWQTLENTDPASEDSKELLAALDRLFEKCSN